MMKPDSIFAITSMTKLITTIAVLQLVEADLVELDSGLDQYLPETINPKIIQGFDKDDNPIFVDAARSPTVRELITHTSGYVYSIWNEMALSAQTRGLLVPSVGERSQLLRHFILSLGRSGVWIGIDWLGVMVEEVSGKRLMEFFERKFLPLRMETHFLFPSEKMDRSVMMTARVKGELVKSELYQPVPAEGSMGFYGGGGGLYSTVSDYARVIRALLNRGVSMVSVSCQKRWLTKCLQSDWQY